MKKYMCSLLLSACFLLASCSTAPEPPQTTISVETETVLPSETEPLHSNLYVPGVSVEDALVYFNEVCLNAEFINSGDPSLLQQWDSPILYALYGNYTAEDLEVLSQFTQWLNALEGFPGISPAQESWQANMAIHFTDQQGLLERMGPQFTGMDGALTFWYEEDVIYDAIICIRTDLDQTLRNSVILEELYNCLGPVQDTSLRSDSIIYSEFSQPQALTAVDELLLKLLYHPALSPGMDAAQCEAVIRELYY